MYIMDLPPVPKKEVPETSWSVFKACYACGAKEKKPCRDRRVKTHFVAATMPHPGRKQFDIQKVRSNNY